MSVSIMAQAWKDSPYKGEKLLVLLALADFANDEGKCWPAISTIARKARITDRAAFRILAEFRQDGVVEVLKQGGGRGKLTVYQVNPAGKTLTESQGNSEAETLTLSAETLTVAARNPDRTCMRNKEEPSGNHHIEQPSSSGEPQTGSPGGGTKKKKADPRHRIFMTLIHDAHLHFVKVAPALGGAAGKRLAELLRACPTLDSEKFRKLLGNYHRSENHGPADSPAFYISKLPNYSLCALDRYGRRLETPTDDELMPGGDVMAEVRRQSQ